MVYPILTEPGILQLLNAVSMLASDVSMKVHTAKTPVSAENNTCHVLFSFELYNVDNVHASLDTLLYTNLTDLP